MTTTSCCSQQLSEPEGERKREKGKNLKVRAACAEPEVLLSRVRISGVGTNSILQYVGIKAMEA